MTHFSTSETGRWGPKVTMTGEWSDEVEDFLRVHNIRDLELNYAKGWNGTKVSFLARLPELEALTIIDHSIKDIAAIHALTGLRYLDVNTYCKTPVYFDRFPLLEECALEWRSGSESIFSHQGLRKIFISKCPLKTLVGMSRMGRLESLALASPKIESLQGIGALRALSFLGLYAARRLTSLEGIQTVPNLVHLEVNDCPHVSSISPVAALLHLRKLHLCNDGNIATIRPLAKLEELEQFLFYESTNVLDGDLSPLKELPKLQHVVFMDRRHYSHRRAAFPLPPRPVEAKD